MATGVAAGVAGAMGAAAAGAAAGVVPDIRALEINLNDLKE